MIVLFTVIQVAFNLDIKNMFVIGPSNFCCVDKNISVDNLSVLTVVQF